MPLLVEFYHTLSKWYTYFMKKIPVPADLFADSKKNKTYYHKKISIIIRATLLVLLVALIATNAPLSPIKIFAEDDELEKLEEEIEEQKEKLEEKESEIGDIKKKADEISNTINKLSGDLNVTQAQMNTLKAQIAELTADIENVNKKMAIKNKEIEEQQKIRNITLRNLYISSQKGSMALLLSEDNLIKSIQSDAYHKRFINDSEQLIGSINSRLNQYESDKKDIEDVKTQIEKQKADMEALAKKLAAQVSSTQGELANVSQKQSALQQEKNEIQRKLNDLSAKQQALLQEKTGTFSTSVGDVPTTGDPNSRPSYDPGFRSAYGVFSFGAPHRKGMSQYGAKGRANEGQSYEDILKAYYGDIEIVKADLPDNINTSSGSMSVDGRYLKGLAEMPASWPMDALKAQAIAARTYAMSYVGWRTGNTRPGGSICTTESCQVWSSSKAESSSAARWHEAVEETKGKIMLGKDTGEIFSAWYAATSGGYNNSYTSLGHTTRGGWDTKCSSKDCWTNDAYENIAESPWFYKGWYKSRSGKSCGRSHPWLTEEEFADIIGAMVLYKEDSDNQKHLSQVDAKSCWGEDIEDTWSRDKVREKTGIEEIKDVDVTYSSDGKTAQVKVETNKGDFSISGDEFKAVFNLRAPGVIHLKSNLFNIEVRE
jgi:peptidoglycan hydrolase-like amidase